MFTIRASWFCPAARSVKPAPENGDTNIFSSSDTSALPEKRKIAKIYKKAREEPYF
jgi:hypothetical protein